jgi:UDP:flavonoid glycosyltransferase YjiC (YdhE family)
MLAALGAGLPLLLLPQGADQFDNATACARAGVARVVTPDVFSPESVSAELRRLLSDARYCLAAQHVRDEIAAISPPADVAPLVEELVPQDFSSERQSAHHTLSVQP